MTSAIERVVWPDGQENPWPLSLRLQVHMNQHRQAYPGWDVISETERLDWQEKAIASFLAEREAVQSC